MKNPEWCIWGLCTGYIVGCTNAWHARLSRKLFLVFLPNWILGDSQGTYIVGVISKEEYYGLFIGFRPSGRVQPVQLWWLVNLPVNSLSQIFTFDLLRLTIKAAIAFDLCVLIRGSILLIVCVGRFRDWMQNSLESLHWWADHAFICNRVICSATWKWSQMVANLLKMMMLHGKIRVASCFVEYSKQLRESWRWILIASTSLPRARLCRPTSGAMT